MLDILFSWLSIPRMIGIWIDSIAFSLIDNAYNLIVYFAGNEFFDIKIINDLKENVYILIFMFALFRLALLLVNALINPEKLTDSGAGLGKIAQNVVIMFGILIITPFIFRTSREIQAKVVEKNYIGKIFGLGIANFNPDESSETNAGDLMKKIAVGALIYPDERLYTKDNSGNITFDSACNDNCQEAINNYNTMMSDDNKVDFGMLAHYATVSVDYNDEEVYAYNYLFIVTLVVGCFITYILLSFAIDIAVRTVELFVLEVLSPIFIATYIDPKSAKSGPFHNWLTTVGKTYVSLYIKLAIVSIMLMLISLINNETNVVPKGGGMWGFLFLMLGILIFAKKAPKWIMGLIGMKGEEGLGGLSIGKKLAGAALVGGALTKGRNAAAGIGMGALRNAHVARKAQKVNMRSSKEKVGNRLKTNYQGSTGNAFSKSAGAIKETFFTKKAVKENLSHYGKTAAAGGLGFIQGAAQGASAGWNAKDLKEVNAKTKADAKVTFDNYSPGFKSVASKIGTTISDVHGKGMQAVLGTDFEIQKRREDAEKDKKALERYGSVSRTDAGKRNANINPVNANEVNTMIRTFNKKGYNFDGASVDGISQALIQARLDTGLLKKSEVKIEADGKVNYKGNIMSAEDFCKQEKIYTVYGGKEIEAIAKDNAYTQATKYVENQGKISKANQTIADINTQVLSFHANVKETRGDAALRNIQKFDEVLSGNTTAQQNFISAQQSVAIAQQDYDNAVAAGQPATVIQSFQAKLQAAQTKLQTAKEVASNEKTTITSMIDRLMGAGTSENYEATVSLRTEAIKESKYLTQENSNIAASVKKNLIEGKASTFHVIDVTTGEEFNFLENSTEVEHVRELLGRARDKAKEDASKLKPKDKDNK